MVKKRLERSPQETARLVHLVEQRYRLLRLIAKLLLNWGGAIGVGYVVIALPVKWSAGKWTAIDLLYRSVLEGTLTLRISRGANAALLLLWIWERRTGNKGIEPEHRRMPELEREIDSRRSTSTPKDSDVHTGGSHGRA